MMNLIGTMKTLTSDASLAIVYGISRWIRSFKPEDRWLLVEDEIGYHWERIA